MMEGFSRDILLYHCHLSREYSLKENPLLDTQQSAAGSQCSEAGCAPRPAFDIK
jgi:hypothetical protein